jgi:hypothetical protein
MWQLNSENKLPFHFNKIGRWWNGSAEIDVVAYDCDGHDIVFGECKYTNAG